MVANIIQLENIDKLVNVLSRKSSDPDQNWLDAAKFIGSVLNAQEEKNDQEGCLLSTLHYLLNDADEKSYRLKETIVHLLGFVDSEANTYFLLSLLRNPSLVGQCKDIDIRTGVRIHAVLALTQIGYRHRDRQEKITRAFQDVFFDEHTSLPANDDTEGFDDTEYIMRDLTRERHSRLKEELKRQIVMAIGNLQNSSLAARKTLLKALEYPSSRYSLRPDLPTSAAEAFASIKLRPDMSEEIIKLLMSLSSPNDRLRDAAWKALNTLDIQTMALTNVN